MNLIVAFDSSDWVGAGLGSKHVQVTHSRRCTRRPDGLRRQPGSAPPSPVGSVGLLGWGLLDAFGSRLGGLGVARGRRSSF